jgi:integrase
VIIEEQETAAAAKSPDNRTVGQLLERYLTHLKDRGRAPKTIESAEREIKGRLSELANTPIRELTPEAIDAAYSRWLKGGATYGKLSASSVHRHAATLSAGLNLGVKWGWLDVNPAHRASAPVQRTERQLAVPSPSQVADLIRAAEAGDPVMAAAIALAFVTGARRGELVALRWSDLDLDGGVVRIWRSLTQVGDEVTEKSTKTDKVRTVSLDHRAVALLRRHRAWQEALSVRAESPLVADPYVLSDNANGARPIPPGKITDRFTALRGKSGVHRVRFHDLRHASITELIRSGVDVKTVSARAGHSRSSMTLDRYAHALPAGDVVAAELIGAMLPQVSNA